MSAIHPALAPFPQDVRDRAWEVYTTLQPNRGDNTTSLDLYYMDPATGERYLCCPIGACLYAMGGGEHKMFPMAYLDILLALDALGGKKVADRLTREAVSQMFALVADRRLTAADFGVQE